MVRKRKLIEQGGTFNRMGFRQGVQIGTQRFGIAGNVDDVVKLRHQLQSFLIDTGTRRIDENSGKCVIRQSNTAILKAFKLTFSGIGFGKFFSRQTGDFDVADAVGFDIPLRRADGGFGDFGCQNTFKLFR